MRKPCCPDRSSALCVFSAGGAGKEIGGYFDGDFNGQKTCPGRYMIMPSVSYTEARDRLASIWDEAVSTREPVVISRRGTESVVLVPLDEWEGLLETAHLLRSPANARRLLAALQRLDEGRGRPLSMEELKQSTGLP